MRYLLTIVLCLALAACSGSSGTADDLASVRAVALDALALLAEGLQREDTALASQPIGERFAMGPNVGLWGGEQMAGAGVGPFRAYLVSLFAVNANISCKLVLQDLQPQPDPGKQTTGVGDVVWATVKVTFNSVHVSSAPPQNFTAEETDYFVFERDNGAWLLERWDEVPPPPPHDEGGGESL